jgi:hypothetical protein
MNLPSLATGIIMKIRNFLPESQGEGGGFLGGTDRGDARVPPVPILGPGKAHTLARLTR